MDEKKLFDEMPLLKEKIDFIEQQLEEYFFFVFKKVIPIPSKKQRIKVITAFKSDLTKTITEILTADKEKFEELKIKAEKLKGE